jgi:hypothetical protein
MSARFALLRSAAGVPIRPESYARAEIVKGRVGLDQSRPVREFDGGAGRLLNKGVLIDAANLDRMVSIGASEVQMMRSFR